MTGIRIEEDWMDMARNLLNGPGFGAPGCTEKEAVELLKYKGLTEEMAFLMVKAGGILLKESN